MLRVTFLALALSALIQQRSLGRTQALNVIIIFCDDLGYGDLGAFGSELGVTPRLDQMAREGVTLTHFYVPQAVCSASRAALLTGCYPPRVGISGALFPDDSTGVAPAETTLAEMFRHKGYQTAAFGKWHLGHLERHLPLQHGFDRFLGIPYSNDMWPHGPVVKSDKYPELPLIEGNNTITHLDDQTDLTSRLTAESLDFIRASATAKKPFFLYLAHPQPHVPLYASERFRGKSGRGLYADVLREIDDSSGQILDELVELGLEESTLTIFTSDNGPWVVFGDHGGSTGGLRGHKGTVWEGGVRVPAILHWPKGLAAGRVIDEPMMTIDLLPTLATLAGAARGDQKIDGHDVSAQLLSESAPDVSRPYFFFDGKNQVRAVRVGQWKLVLAHRYRDETVAPGAKGRSGKYGSLETELALFDLQTDPAESVNLADKHPGKVKDLQEHIRSAQRRFGDAAQKIEGTEVREPGH